MISETEIKKTTNILVEIKQLKAKNSLLEQRALLARELAIGYDGFNTTDGLKSLIDDMVRALKGELSFTNSKGEKIDQDEVYKCYTNSEAYKCYTDKIDIK